VAGRDVGERPRRGRRLAGGTGRRRTREPQGGGKPGGALADKIAQDFGTFEAFKAQFSDAAKNVEASGWAMLTYDTESEALLIYQVEKQNFMHPPGLPLLLTLDVWEHAYYLQYKNDRGAYVDAWWNVVNWDDVDKRYRAASG